MKKKLMIALTAVSALGFAAETIPASTTSALPKEVRQSLAQAQKDRDWFGYMRMGLADSRATDMARVLPGLGLGWRYALPLGAIDVSASYTGVEAFATEKSSYFFTAPRVSYLLYASPTKAQSFYAGAGLAYGGVKTQAKDAQPATEDKAAVAAKPSATFDGIIPSVSLGYEMNRLANWTSFIQLDVSQPALATAAKDKSFLSLANADFGPLVELSVGFGY